MSNYHLSLFIVLLLLLQYFMNVFSNLLCEQYPQPMSIANIDQTDVDLWIEVRRDSTKSIGDGWLALGLNKIDKKFRNFTALFQAYGWYEGYSAGFPSQPPKTYVSYGCWFWPFGMWAHNTHSNIFIRLGNFFRGEHYVIQNKFGLPGGSDKGYCGAAMQHGLDSVFIDMDGYYQLIHCTNGCAVTSFNTTCPPDVELRGGYRASEECSCSDANSALNCDLSVRSGSQPSDGFSKHNSVTRHSISTNKCIYEPPKMIDIKPTSISAFNISIVFTVGLLRDSRAFLDVSSSIGSVLGMDNTLLLNWETLPHLEFFGHYSENKKVGSHHAHHQNLDLDMLSNASAIRLVGRMDDADSKRIIDSLLPFYTNVPGFINPALVNITGVLVGVITYDDRLVITGRLTWTELCHWIVEESKCLRKRGADVVVLMGHAQIDTNALIYKRAKDYVNVVLGVHGIHTTEPVTCRGLWYGELTDRIVQLPANSRHPHATKVELYSTGINNQQFIMKSSSWRERDSSIHNGRI